jgi:hypothetical protein
MSFNKSFLDILQGNDSLDVIYNDCISNGIDGKFNYDLLPKTVDNAIKLAPFLLQNMKKQQVLIETTPDYYIAQDTVDNTIYICYKNLMVIDIDDKLKNVVNHFSLKKESFSIFSSRNGYHVFCISKKVDYRDKETISFMIDNFCDFYYSIHTYIRGFCVRLNKKFDEDENGLPYQFVKLIDNGNIDPHLLDLTNKHFELTKKYSIGSCCFPTLQVESKDIVC